MADLGDGPARATVEASVDGPGTALVNITGELDLSSVPGVEVALEAFLVASPDRVVLDMSAVTFMDSSGIAMLLRAAERVARLEVRNPSDSVQLVLRTTGLTSIFHMEA